MNKCFRSNWYWCIIFINVSWMFEFRFYSELYILNKIRIYVYWYVWYVVFLFFYRILGFYGLVILMKVFIMIIMIFFDLNF